MPIDWNASSDSFSLKYKHSQSAFTFLLKAVQLESKLVLHGMAVEDGCIHDLQLDIDSLLIPNVVFPLSSLSIDALLALFVSKERVDEMVYQFKVKIVQKFVPGLNKPGYEESKPSVTSASSSQYIDPLSHSRIPGRPVYIDPYNAPFGNPYSIGDIDRDPFAASPGISTPFNSGLARPNLGGGGMIVGPGHPMFNQQPFPMGPQQPHFFPAGAVPPGARFDPVSPLVARPRPNQYGPRFLSGDPDNDEAPPSGYNDMFM